MIMTYYMHGGIPSNEKNDRFIWKLCNLVLFSLHVMTLLLQGVRHQSGKGQSGRAIGNSNLVEPPTPSPLGAKCYHFAALCGANNFILFAGEPLRAAPLWDRSWQGICPWCGLGDQNFW